MRPPGAASPTEKKTIQVYVEIPLTTTAPGHQRRKSSGKFGGTKLSSRPGGPRAGVGVLGRGAASPPPHQLGGLGERCKLPSGVRGGAPKLKFGAT